MKSCPFCGEEDHITFNRQSCGHSVDVGHQKYQSVDGAHSMVCRNCGARGPEVFLTDRGSSEILWDRRVDPSRESVRRLVGEWKKKEASIRKIANSFNEPSCDRLYEQADMYAVYSQELSALIDGKDGDK